MAFTGKNILVIGASSGIGLATAQLLQASGATLFTASRHLSPELAALGTTHLTYDATQPVGPAFDALPEVLHGLVSALAPSSCGPSSACPPRISRVILS
jgi:3-oxoacyl-[acyl-carrier protein] reductase